ncbi:MAG: 5-oxoprolinase subunit PxpA [Propionicimonas sp.]|nr:5-oxoprolinase subunit PxpA [Propionicimonas sp.]
MDLNADLGESFGAWLMGDDAAMLDVVTSASIACGFHAGDPRTILRTVELATERGVAVGAHVAYRDLAGFGRRFIDVDPADLRADVIYQLSALAGCCAVAGTALAYVKPHGALYNTIVSHPAQAEAVARAVADFDPRLVLLGVPGAGLDAAAAAGLPTAVEAFADRAYAPDGTLVPRGRPGAVLTDPDLVADRVVRLATAGYVSSSEGLVAVRADSICVHGDTPGAVTIARRVRETLETAGVEVTAFVPR